ncbi:MAG: hypothetical protein F6J87_16725, partial [Spirulina sp. SIO3F2]|nr:hypothetical protein [Spirulina sp. SIO3F2]
CIAEVDRVAARQSQDNDGVVRSASARKIIYQNPYGSITIACFEEQVVVIIFHSVFDEANVNEFADLVIGDIFPE